MDILDRIGKIGLVPVVVMERAQDAPKVAKALMDGGLPIMEITMRTAAGIDSIKSVKESCPDMLVGAGTVLTLEQCMDSVKAGAEFIVSPGFNPTIVDWCVSEGVPITPGCVTPTEIEMALARGLKVLKFFPASVYGGIKACESLQGPYKSAGVKFIPTGGVDLGNLDEYSSKPFIHAIGGGWLANGKAIASGDFHLITQTAAQSIKALLGFKVAHVGINTPDSQQGLALSSTLTGAFGFEMKNGPHSCFVGDGIEIMMPAGPGASGHVAMFTNHVQRAIHYLSERGFQVDESTAKYEGSRLVKIYLVGDFGGFAIHLIQK